MRLTKTAIDTLACPPGKRDILVFDDDLPGFGIRVTTSGHRTFIFQYQLGGRGGTRRRMVLGRYGEITPSQARAAAEVARGDVRKGGDPARAKAETDAAAKAEKIATRRRADAEALTFGALIEDWARVALVDRSASHRHEAPRRAAAVYAKVRDCPANTLDGGELQRITDAMVTSAPISARRALSYARAAFSWALRRGYVSGNPFLRVVIDRREVSRDRVLADAELGEIMRAARRLPYPFGPFVLVLLLTLQRRGEVAGMAWSEIAPDRATWTIPSRRAKNRRAQIVHLAPAVRELLAGLPRVAGRPLVFGATRARRRASKDAPAPEGPRSIGDFSGVKQKLFAQITVERAQRPEPAEGWPPFDWRLHDFRRAGVSAMARLGVGHHVADRILNHVHGAGAIRGVAAVYQRHEFLAEREAALRTWADHLASTAESPVRTPNVVRLRRR